MNKSPILAVLAIFFLTISSISAQEVQVPDRPNEIYGGYGAGSLYYFSGTIPHPYQMYDSYYYYTDETDPTSVGTFFLGFNRSLGKVISVGFEASYMQLKQKVAWSQDPYTGDTTLYTGENTDDLLTGLGRVTFNYLRKPYLTMYSGVAIGVTIDLGRSVINGIEETDRVLKPAGQLTFFGLRAGKALGGFLEFGVGTNGILTAGISYKIKD